MQTERSEMEYLGYTHRWVVLCKNCKWFVERNGEHLCGAWEEIFYNPVEENGYCYKGVRKDEAGK